MELAKHMNAHLIAAGAFLVISIATFALWPDLEIKWLFVGLFAAELLSARNKRGDKQEANSKAEKEKR
jgi:hypothetical protein